MKNLLTIIALSLALAGCGKGDIEEPIEYTGPVREAEDVEFYYSDKDMVKIKMTAPLLHEFKTGDQEFPDGIYMEFFDEAGRLESTLKANHAYYFKTENQWRGRGNVEVINLQQNEQLNTEELFWKPGEKKIFTDKFVTIKQQGDVIYGEGLDAKEDLSEYTITKLTGRIQVDE